MLQKEKSATKSSKSPTNRDSSTSEKIFTPIQFVKGVGPKLSFIFKSRDILSVKDLLYFFPRNYEDRTKTLKIQDLKAEAKVSVSGKIISSRRIPLRTHKTLHEVRISDETGILFLKWFHLPKGLEQKFIPGTTLTATGNIKFYMGKPEMVHPELNWRGADEDTVNLGRVIPVYTEIEGLHNRLLRKLLWHSVQEYSSFLPEDLPRFYIERHSLPSLHQAISLIHFPNESSEIEPILQFKTKAHARLIYEEFLKFQFLVLKQRLKLKKELAVQYPKKESEKILGDMEKRLPFILTQGQKDSVRDILDDLTQNYPMNRLIQGDVGSGKTAVAFLAACSVIAQGDQVALMAPTEILAEQHFKNAKKLFQDKITTLLLTGKTTAADRKKILPLLESGKPCLLIGTHALIEEDVIFKNLSLILIDEQHRFGVDQRRALRNKGIRKIEVSSNKFEYLFPHVLVLTATPIPRTLALTAYGDLSVSTISELPPGRTPIQTKVCKSQTEIGKAYLFIREELKKGRQAYFIYPLVNESEAEGFTHLKSAEKEFERLSRDVFPEYKLGLLHGQMKSDEKNTIMEKFQNQEIQILISTTVVEVGVDNPNATIIVIEHSERFGLSQLHQLRGRVGRGQHASYCFLMTHVNAAETSTLRLEVLEETSDGFKISEADLEMRGPGEFLGTKQSGDLPFKIANLVRDRDWLIKARNDATELLSSDPELEKPENAQLRHYYEREGVLQFDRLKTS